MSLHLKPSLIFSSGEIGARPERSRSNPAEGRLWRSVVSGNNNKIFFMTCDTVSARASTRDRIAGGLGRAQRSSARGRLRFFPLVDLNELDGGDRRDPDGLRQSLPWQTMRSKI